MPPRPDVSVPDVPGIAEGLVGAGIVGAAVAVQTGEAAPEAAAAGLSDLGRGVAMRPDQRFRIASITKTFVAATALQLCDEGALSLDDAIGRWLPGRPHADTVTLRHVLTHTGGLPSWSPYALDDYPEGDPGPPSRAYVDVAYRLTAAGPPGGGFAYANIGSRIVGTIVEQVTGERLPDRIERRLLRPLGLADTVPSGRLGPLPDRLARGYYHAGGDAPPRDVTEHVPPAFLWSGGDMVSTVADLLRWMRALFGGAVLTAATTRAAMVDSLVPGAFDGSSMSHHGLVSMVFGGDGCRVFGYRGSTPGYVGIAGYAPDRDVAVAVLTNSFSPDPHAVQRAAVESAMFRAIDAGGSGP